MASEPADTDEREITGSHLFEKSVPGVKRGGTFFYTDISGQKLRTWITQRVTVLVCISAMA